MLCLALLAFLWEFFSPFQREDWESQRLVSPYRATQPVGMEMTQVSQPLVQGRCGCSLTDGRSWGRQSVAVSALMFSPGFQLSLPLTVSIPHSQTSSHIDLSNYVQRTFRAKAQAYKRCLLGRAQICSCLSSLPQPCPFLLLRMDCIREVRMLKLNRLCKAFFQRPGICFQVWGRLGVRKEGWLPSERIQEPPS